MDIFNKPLDTLAAPFVTGFKKFASSPVTKSVASFFWDTSAQLWGAGKYLYHSPSFKQTANNVLVQSWEGVKHSFNWGSVYRLMVKSPKLQAVVKQSFITNIVLYAGPVIVYEGWVKPGLRALSPELENSSLEASYDYPVQALFFTFYLGALIKNVSSSVIISGETAKYAPKQNFHDCGHGMEENGKAEVRSLLIHPKNLITAKCAEMLGGRVLGNLVQSLAIGQYLIETKLSLFEVCTDDRAKQLSANNFYSLVYGLFFLGVYESGVWLLKQAALGVTSSYIDDGVKSFTLLIFVMHSMLREEALPGKEAGFDVFEYNRVEISGRLAKFAEWLLPQLKNEESRRDMQAAAVGVANFPPIKLAAAVSVAGGLYPYKKFYHNPSLLFSKKLFTAESLLTIPELRGLVEIKNDGIKNGVKKIQMARMVRSVSWIGAFIPSILVSSNLVNAGTMLGKLDPMFVNQVALLPEIAARAILPTQEDGAQMETLKTIEDSYIPRPGQAGSDIDKYRALTDSNADATAAEPESKSMSQTGWQAPFDVVDKFTQPQQNVLLSPPDPSSTTITTIEDDEWVLLDSEPKAKITGLRRNSLFPSPINQPVTKSQSVPAIPASNKHKKLNPSHR